MRRAAIVAPVRTPVGAFGGVLDSSGDGGVDADAARGVARRAFGRRQIEDVLFLGNGHGIQCRSRVSGLRGNSD